MASQTASPISRLPRQERGRLRVAALLRGAEAAIGEKGYEAATMTEIADRAGAAIGSLYQFFATKEAIADTLRAQLNGELCDSLAALAGEAAGWDADRLADRLFQSVLGFLGDHPALMAIADARGTSAGALSGILGRLRAAIAQVLVANAPELAADRARLMAVVVWQIMRAAAALASESGLREKRAALDEIRGVLAVYLRDSIRA